MLTLALCLFTAGAFAAASTQPPQVSIPDGVVIGVTSDRVDTFTGIPFAQPPVGNLRLKPPQALSAPFGTLNATGTPAACPAPSRLVRLRKIRLPPVHLFTKYQEMTTQQINVEEYATVHWRLRRHPHVLVMRRNSCSGRREKRYSNNTREATTHQEAKLQLLFTPSLAVIYVR